MRYLFLIRPYRLKITVIKDLHVSCVSGDHQTYLFNISIDKLEKKQLTWRWLSKSREIVCSISHDVKSYYFDRTHAPADSHLKNHQE
jgi:hypothetical protein